MLMKFCGLNQTFLQKVFRIVHLDVVIRQKRQGFIYRFVVNSTQLLYRMIYCVQRNKYLSLLPNTFGELEHLLCLLTIISFNIKWINKVILEKKTNLISKIPSNYMLLPATKASVTIEKIQFWMQIFSANHLWAA